MKISIDHVTNSSSESFGTAILDTVISIAAGIPFIAVTLGLTGTSDVPPAEIRADAGASADPDDPAGTIIRTNSDGSVTKTLPDGTVGTKMLDGTVYVNTADGMTGVISPDGTEKYTSPDGSVTEIYTDGSTHVTTPDNGEVFKDKSGNYSGKMITSDGMTFEIKGSDQREVTLTNPGGIKIVIDKNGVKGTIVSDDGSFTIDGGGNIDSKGNDGSSDRIVQNPDGSSRWTHQDPDGTTTTADVSDDGHFEFSGSDGSKEVLVTSADGSSTLTQVSADGSKTTCVAGTDGFISILTPEGGQITFGQDGSVTMAGPDGQAMTFSSDDIKSLEQILSGGDQ